MGIFDDLKSLNKAHKEALIPEAKVELEVAKMYETKIKEAESKMRTAIEGIIEQCTDINHEENNYDAGKRDGLIELEKELFGKE